MVVYSYNHWQERVEALHWYVKETEKFFVKANGSRDAKSSSWAFLSTSKQEVIDHVIKKNEKAVVSLQIRLESFEEEKRRELERLQKQYQDATKALEQIKEKLKG